MKILLLAPFPYGPSSGQGGATACTNALVALSQQHQVFVLCFCKQTRTELATLADMRVLAHKVQTVVQDIGKMTVLKAKLTSIVSTTPEHALYFQSDAFVTALQATIQSEKPDLIITQFPQMAQYLSHCGQIPTVHDVQDAFSVSWFRRAQSAKPGWQQWLARKQWRNWLAYEAEHYLKANQCWTLSDQDKYGLTVFNPSLSTHTVGLPLTRSFGANAEVDGKLRVGFIGSFGHPPNLEALDYLLNSIVPNVMQKVPGACFVIAGRNAPQHLIDNAPAHVQFVGFVNSLQDFYASCDVVVAPLLSGGGIKIKVAEAMCYGRAVVTTPIGAEGIPIETGTNAIVAANAVDFASAVCSLLANKQMCAQMGQLAMAVARDAFATDRWLDRVELLLEKVKPVTKLPTAQ